MYKYFAYGSNMDPVQMKTRCPEHKLYATAYLENYRLIFPRVSMKRGCAVASIEPANNSTIYGVVCEITKNDLDSLRKSEGFALGRQNNSYQETNIEVINLYDNNKISCITYIATPQITSELPSVDYVNHFISGAINFGFPEDYISYLKGIKTK